MEKQLVFIAAVCLASILVIATIGISFASETYSFRGKAFEANSECAQNFIDYQTAKPYDWEIMVPALMNFDQRCDPGTP